MLFLLSPAKTLALAPVTAFARSEPLFAADAVVLSKQLAALTPAALRAVLEVSAPLAELNAARYKAFPSAAEKQAVLAFDGPAYKALDAAKLNTSQLEYVQSRLRILCGLYGVLRPLDAIKPYRLEMGCKLATARGKDLYAYWGGRVCDAVAADVAALQPGERCLVNVASAEYFAVLKPHLAATKLPVYTMALKGATVHVKAARGAFVRFAALTNATKPEELRGFTGLAGEWRYNAAESDEFSYSFERCAPARPAPAPKVVGKRGKAAEEPADDAAPAKAARGAAKRRS